MATLARPFKIYHLAFNNSLVDISLETESRSDGPSGICPRVPLSLALLIEKLKLLKWFDI